MIEVLAPAKLTLSLRITGVRADGYHEIDAEMATLDFCDRLEIEPSPDGAVAVRMLDAAGDDCEAGLPPGDNLVVRALGLAGRRARVTVHKRIPAGAGLGGGSADAAAVLRWAGFTDTVRAASIGADVAFCLAGGRARVQGIGELVEPLGYVREQYTLLLVPLLCSTAAVYAAWDDLGGPAGRQRQRPGGRRAPGGAGAGVLARRVRRRHRPDPPAGGKRQHLVRGRHPPRTQPGGSDNDRAAATPSVRARGRACSERPRTGGSRYLRR